MREIQIEPLTREALWPFGYYANLMQLDAERIGEPPIEFFRDMLQIPLSSATSSVSVCLVQPRPFVIDRNEYHTSTCEGFMPLDNDIAVHVAPASARGAERDKLKVFYIPQGTMVVIRPGVWHHAPFALNNRPVRVLTVLPERTYANDCVSETWPEAERVSIGGADRR